MPGRHVRRSLLLGATLLIAACGGTPTTGPGGATNQPGATTGPGGGGATPAPVATQGGGGGGSISHVCELLTVSEIESIMSVTGVSGTETAIISESGACVYLTGTSDIAVALSFTGSAAGAQVVWDTWKTQPEAVQLSGIDGEAVFMPSAETTFLFKNGKLIGIQAGNGAAGADQRKAWETELAKKIAGRL
ncbi:MAG: hypothetical protein ABIZ52_06665 [Candidatus Limnocylindrales bacterium]